MNKNVGRKDKYLRITMAVALLPLFFLRTGPLRWLGLLSVPLLVTGLTQRCGMYAVTGMNTFESD